MVIWPNFTGMIPGWSPIKVVQTLPVGCISRSRVQKIGFQNAILKNLLVRKKKAQSFHIWYIASSRGPLPKLFKLCPWGSLLLAPLWPLTFSSGERPRALWALLFCFNHNCLPLINVTIFNLFLLPLSCIFTVNLLWKYKCIWMLVLRSLLFMCTCFYEFPA